MKNIAEYVCNCKERGCGKPMEIIFQEVFNPARATCTSNGKLGIALATCKTPGCSFNGVTLQPEEHDALTEEQREFYRASVRDIADRQASFNWREVLAG